MPILPPTNAAIYDTLEQAMQLARTRMNDAINSLGGEVFTDNAVFTQTICNGAWRRMCEFLGNLGYTRLIQETILTQCPVVANTDPASQCFVNWSQYFDGETYWQTPVLPQDMIAPLKIWERPSSGNWTFPVHPNMENMVDGIPAMIKRQRNHFWEWRQDALYMPGALVPVDLRIRYISFLTDFVTEGGVEYYNQPIPIARCLSPLSKYMCYEVCMGRGDLDAATFAAEGEAEAKLIVNRDMRARQRVNIRRQPCGESRRGGYGWGMY